MLRHVKKNLKNFSLSKLLCLAIFFSPLLAAASPDLYVFASAQKREQFAEIIDEMRCLVCQNQNLADSNAPLAQDLRLVIYRRIKNSESPTEIKKYLISRYGNFISFRPVFSRLTYCLWLSPFILLLVIFLIFLLKAKKFDTQFSNGLK
ncbi:cytochrome c-type biogenesis protein [Rickettsiella endosymbiont of Rhagonycha lignosa]|uniref:cytochrome c-type biogenesis protein n=1 Tax=Rickettsiella endosymbiont of Rhagonycha lignosa TaxID=3077937 RepID=UPI00313D2EDF